MHADTSRMARNDTPLHIPNTVAVPFSGRYPNVRTVAAMASVAPALMGLHMLGKYLEADTQATQELALMLLGVDVAMVALGVSPILVVAVVQYLRRRRHRMLRAAEVSVAPPAGDEIVRGGVLQALARGIGSSLAVMIGAALLLGISTPLLLDRSGLSGVLPWIAIVSSATMWWIIRRGQRQVRSTFWKQMAQHLSADTVHDPGAVAALTAWAVSLVDAAEESSTPGRRLTPVSAVYGTVGDAPAMFGDVIVDELYRSRGRTHAMRERVSVVAVRLPGEHASAAGISMTERLSLLKPLSSSLFPISLELESQALAQFAQIRRSAAADDVACREILDTVAVADLAESLVEWQQIGHLLIVYRRGFARNSVQFQRLIDIASMLAQRFQSDLPVGHGARPLPRSG